MPSKPSTLPEWASSGSITEPTLTEKQTGWTATEPPPAEYFNWWQNLVWLWMLWLNAFETIAHTWSALQTFTAGISVTGGLTVDTLNVSSFAAPHTVGGGGEPAFASGCSNVSGKTKTVFWKSPDGAVHIRGATSHAAATQWDVFTLPSTGAWRPPGDVQGPALDWTGSGGVGAVTVHSSGIVHVSTTAASSTEISFEICFRPDAAVAP